MIEKLDAVIERTRRQQKHLHLGGGNQRPEKNLNLDSTTKGERGFGKKEVRGGNMTDGP